MINLRILLFALITFTAHQYVLGQIQLDSLMQLHYERHSAYEKDRAFKGERTWSGKVEFDRKAAELIETDRIIIGQITDQWRQEKTGLQEKLEMLLLEKALLERENEVREMALNRKITIQKSLAIATGLMGILFIVSLLVMFTLKSKYQSVKRELERMYSSADNTIKTEIASQDQTFILNKLNMMNESNEKLKQDLNRVSGEKSEALEALKKEIRDRKKVEQEIKNLLEQIKKQ